MAYYNNVDDKEKGDTSQGMNQTQPVQLSGQTSTIGSQAPAAKPVNAPVKSASSGASPSFQNFAKANQGKAQDSLNSAAAQNVSNQGQAAKSSINQANTQFGQRVDQGSLKDSQNALTDVQSTVDSARNLQAGSALEQSQQDRFKEIINARYQGPESLRQAGLYNKTAGVVDTAQNAITNTKTALGREDLLRSMFQNKGNYTSGLNKLDSALVNSSQQGVQNLQNAAEQQGNLGQQLDKAQIGSVNAAQNRTADINRIKKESREAFSAGKTAEEKQTEDRITAMTTAPALDEAGNQLFKTDGTPMSQWDRLPEQFRNVIANKTSANQSMLDGKIAEFKANNTSPDDAAIKAAQQKLIRANRDVESNISTDLSQPFTITPAQLQAIQQAKAELDQVQAQKSQYDQQLSDISKNFNMDQVNFNSLEARMLGINAGEGLYNLGTDSIKSGIADNNRLVTKNEQARQAALAQLAGLDTSNMLDTNLRYEDADLAGTQSALDALDIKATREGLNAAEQQFRNTANATNLVGEGSKKVSRGNAFGKKTKEYTATLGGNAGDFLEGSGYDLNSEMGAGQNVASSRDLLNAALAASSGGKNNADAEDNKKVLQSSAQGAVAGAGIGTAIGGAGIGTGIGAVVGTGIGTIIGSGTVDPSQQMSDLMAGMGGPGAAIGKGIQDGRRLAGDAAGTFMQVNPFTNIADDIGKKLGLGSLTAGVQGAIGGIDSGAMKQFGDSRAKFHAAEDLKNKYSGFLDSQGFQNRAGVVDNAQTTSRLSALEQLLANMDKSNT